MNNILLSEYIDYYNKYKSIYSNLINDLCLSLNKQLLNTDNLSISVEYDKNKLLNLSILSKEQEDSLLINHKDYNTSLLDVGISSSLVINKNDYCTLSHTKNNIFTTSIGTIRLCNTDQLLKILGKFSEISNGYLYLELIKFSKDSWNDYLQILLDYANKESDILSKNIISNETILEVTNSNKELNGKHLEVDCYGNLKFVYSTISDDDVSEKREISNIDPCEILKSIYLRLSDRM